MKWTSASFGSKLQHYFFYILVNYKLLWLARLCLYCVVFYYSVKPITKNKSIHYLKRRFPQSGALALWKHTYILYLNFAELLLDRVVFASHRSIDIGRDCEKTDKVLFNAINKQQGCIILSAHVGAWQLGMNKIEFSETPIHLLQFNNAKQNDKHYFEHNNYNQKSYINIIDSNNPIQASIEVSMALQKKEIVCIMGDRLVSKEEKIIEVDFLGEKIALPLSPFSIASITQSPIVITFSVREKTGIKGVWAEEINVPRGIQKDSEKLKPYVQKYLEGLNFMVEHYPHHYFNFYNIWEKLDDN